MKLHERAKLQFIFEAFNIFNRFSLTSTGSIRAAQFAVTGA